MKRFHFYDKGTGVFADRVYSASEPELALNTPAGHAAIEGTFDVLSQRVDVAKVEADRAAYVSAHASRVEARRASYRPAIPGETFKEPPAPPPFSATAAHVVDHQPPPPSADHEWDATTKRWRLKPEVVQRNAQRAEAHAQIRALEATQPRAVREALCGDATAVQRLRAIDAAITKLRTEL